MSNTNGQMDVVERVIVALDYPDAASAGKLLEQLRGVPCYLKVGMELFYAAGPDFVLKLKDQGFRVFLDLKLHDIPNTVKGGSASIARLGVDMFNVHAAGGQAMMEAAREGIELALAGQSGAKRPILIGVTQLTSTSRQMLNDQIGIPGSVEEAVIRYAELTQRSGLDGVVASALEVARIKERCGEAFVTVTPGIRPAGSELGDQSRVMTPAEAFRQGTDYIVVGRPITKADDPRLALEQLVQSITE